LLAVFLAARNPSGREIIMPKTVPQKPIATVSAPMLKRYFHPEKSGGSISRAKASDWENPPMRAPISTFETLQEKTRITRKRDHHSSLWVVPFRHCQPARQRIHFPLPWHKYPEP